MREKRATFFTLCVPLVGLCGRKVRTEMKHFVGSKRRWNQRKEMRRKDEKTRERETAEKLRRAADETKS